MMLCFIWPLTIVEFTKESFMLYMFFFLMFLAHICLQACARKHVHSVSFSLMMVLLQVDFMHLKYLIDRTPFLQRLERENDLSLMGRVKKNDDLQSFYQHYYSKYIQALQNAADNTDRA